MPELPEVETMARGIARDCTNRIVDRLEFVQIERRPMFVAPDRDTVACRVQGRRISSVRRLAKRIVLELDSQDSLVVEPRMTGLLVVTEPPTAEHRRIVWHFQREQGLSDSLEFWDRRGLGTLSLLTPEQLQELRSRLGPDALEITADEWLARLKKTERQIKVALLDQQLVAGIGNLYASEILHRSGISPLRAATRLTKNQINRLAEATSQILSDAIHYEGSTLNDGTYRNALNKDGSYQNHHRVYQRADLLCLTCRTDHIRRIVQSQRATFFCPKCQK
jgi:formamidopyrimidine-DNA glycosylase